jgi:hypothetical protein
MRKYSNRLDIGAVIIAITLCLGVILYLGFKVGFKNLVIHTTEKEDKK